MKSFPKPTAWSVLLKESGTWSTSPPRLRLFLYLFRVLELQRCLPDPLPPPMSSILYFIRAPNHSSLQIVNSCRNRFSSLCIQTFYCNFTYYQSSLYTNSTRPSTNVCDRDRCGYTIFLCRTIQKTEIHHYHSDKSIATTVTYSVTSEIPCFQ